MTDFYGFIFCWSCHDVPTDHPIWSQIFPDADKHLGRVFHIKHRPQHLGYIKEAEYILSSEGQSLSFSKQDYCGIWQNRTHMLNDTRHTELHYSSLFKFTTTVYEKLPEIIWVASRYLLLRLLSKTQETQYNNTRSTLIQWTRSTPITQGLGSSLTELWEQIFLA